MTNDSSLAQGARAGRSAETDLLERYRLDDLEIDVVRREVRRGDERLQVNGLSFDLLLTLIRAAPDLVTNDELMQRVWAGLVVGPDTVTQRVKLVRDALGDDARAPRYILGVRGRGYRAAVAAPPTDTAKAADAAQAPSAVLDSIVPHRSRRRFIAACLVTLVAAAVAAVLSFPSQPSIAAYKQLTLSRESFSPYWSPVSLVLDEANVYFNEWEYTNHNVARRVSIDGGESVPLVPPFGDELIAELAGITPHTRELLFSVYPKDDFDPQIFWRWREGFAPSRFGELEGANPGWSFDGQWVAYHHDGALFVARADGTQPRKVASVGSVKWPRFSPDGSRIRFTLQDPRGFWTLWEIATDGSGLHRFLDGSNTPSHACCGNWTPDGKTYVFEATHDGVAQLWALREAPSPFERSPPKPVRLTEGPMSMTRPIVSQDGKHIYAVGVHLRADVMRYDPSARGFVADELKGRAAEWLSYSADAKWVSYVAYPDPNLWRSKRDGSQAIQLTRYPFRAVNSAWSPDGETIAFDSLTPGGYSKVYRIRADGAEEARALTENTEAEWSPTWSPDGQSLVFCTHKGIQIFDVPSGKVSAFEGGESKFAPAWSSSGRYLAAKSWDGRIWLFDFMVRRWDEVQRVDDALYLRWSPDEQFLYIATGNFNPSLERVRMNDRSLERVASAKDEKWLLGIQGAWAGVTPEGHLLYLRDTGVSYIYALDFES